MPSPPTEDRLEAECAALEALAEPQYKGDPHRGLAKILREGRGELADAMTEARPFRNP